MVYRPRLLEGWAYELLLDRSARQCGQGGKFDIIDQSECKIVLVDDEEMVVTSIKSFLNVERNYEVVAFTSPKVAMEFINKNEVDLVAIGGGTRLPGRSSPSNRGAKAGLPSRS